MSKSTHAAVVTTAKRAPLSILQVPTPKPEGNEVLVRNLWTASTPLDLHQADGGLLVNHPQVLGDGVAGTVTAVGPTANQLKSGDLVFGFTWRSQREKAHQEYVCAPENLLAKVPPGWENRLQEVVTLPNNVVTAWHTLSMDLGLKLAWPSPENVPPQDKDKAILIWGGSSSVGQFTLQILRWLGYQNVVATASPRNFELVKAAGANAVFDYSSPAFQIKIEQYLSKKVDLVLDCIGSLEGSVRPISKLAGPGTKVAVLLPVVVKDSSEDSEPEYAMDVGTVVDWEERVEVKGVRTHHYLENEFHAQNLQPDIMPTLLSKGVVLPNKQKIVEGATILERAQKALDMLRRKEVSAERLVWRVADEYQL